jgi:uncharacterized phage protein gp47/JayE
MAVEDLTSTQDEEELFEQFATDAATLDYPVDVRGMQPERIAHAWLSVEAKSHEQYQIKRKSIVESGWRQTAKGDSLTLFARGFHQIERYPATQAVHQFRLSDVSSVGPVNVAAGERVAYANNGQEFRNVDALVVPLDGYIDGNWKAEESGALANVAVGTVTRLRAPIVGVTVSNPAISGEAGSIVTAGRNQETDAQLGQRLDDHWGSVGSGGNEAAYRFWVTESFDVDGLTSSITRIKILTNNPYGPGSIGVIIANAGGSATGAEITRVDEYLQDRKALGSGQLLVSAATSQSVLVSGSVGIRAGYVEADVLTAIEEALDTYESEFSIGGYLYRAELIQRVMDVDGVYNFTLVDPVANVAINDTAIVAFTYAITAA